MRNIIYIGIIGGMLSCTAPSPELQAGDLLFQVGNGAGMNQAIDAATRSDNQMTFTHVGIAIPHHGADSVLEATSEGGVKLSPLDEFLDRAARVEGGVAVVAMRLRDTTGRALALKRARERLGIPYDYSFLPDNGKLYCSELVWECFRNSDGAPRFPARPMNFRAADGSMPAFWTELFEQLGETIPEGIPGTNPNDMARDPQLYEVKRWF